MGKDSNERVSNFVVFMCDRFPDVTAEQLSKLMHWFNEAHAIADGKPAIEPGAYAVLIGSKTRFNSECFSSLELRLMERLATLYGNRTEWKAPNYKKLLETIQ